MLRKILLGLVTVASLSAIALAPTEASARGMGGRGGGFGGGHFAGFGGHHGGGFGGWHHGFGGVGLGLLGLDLAVAAAEASTCRQVITANGRVLTIC